MQKYAKTPAFLPMTLAPIEKGRPLLSGTRQLSIILFQGPVVVNNMKCPAELNNFWKLMN